MSNINFSTNKYKEIVIQDENGQCIDRFEYGMVEKIDYGKTGVIVFRKRKKLS
jgi:hypothetical protein